MTTRLPTRTGTATPSDSPDRGRWSRCRPALRIGRAVSLGLALLKAARVESWADLVDRSRTDPQSAAAAAGRHRPDPADLALLDAHLGLLGLIRVVPAHGGPEYRHRRGLRHLRAVDVSAGAVPRKCRFTLGCSGAMVKAVRPSTRNHCGTDPPQWSEPIGCWFAVAE